MGQQTAKATGHMDIKPVATLSARAVGEQESSAAGHMEVKPVASLASKAVGEMFSTASGHIEVKPVEATTGGHVEFKPVAQLESKETGYLEATSKGHIELSPVAQLETKQTGELQAKPSGYVEVTPVAQLETKSAQSVKPSVTIHASIKETLKEYAVKIWSMRLGERWKHPGLKLYHGPNWSIAVLNEDNKETIMGMGPRRTTIFALARRISGEINEITLGPYSSATWEKNSEILYPQINMWVMEVSGSNPNLI